jgi:hypothetical protein
LISHKSPETGIHDTFEGPSYIYDASGSQQNQAAVKACSVYASVFHFAAWDMASDIASDMASKDRLVAQSALLDLRTSFENFFRELRVVVRRLRARRLKNDVLLVSRRGQFPLALV